MPFTLPAQQQQPGTLKRILTIAAAMVILGVSIVLGVFVFALLVVVGLAALIWFRWKMRKAARASASTASNDAPHIIEGEYTVVDDDHDGWAR